LHNSYKFDIDLVMDFAKFCEQSGGFSICWPEQKEM
jgi:hypothetical protein